jgi:PKD repeat protein
VVHEYDVAGEYTVTLTVTDETGLNDTETRVVTVETVPDPVCSTCGNPTDPDDDGLYEDVDGSGGFTFFDVLALYDYFRNAESPAVEPFDFSEDGAFTFFDVLALYDEFQES